MFDLNDYLGQVDEPVEKKHPPVVDGVDDLNELERGLALEQQGAVAVLNKPVVRKGNFIK